MAFLLRRFNPKVRLSRAVMVATPTRYDIYSSNNGSGSGGYSSRTMTTTMTAARGGSSIPKNTTTALQLLQRRDKSTLIDGETNSKSEPSLMVVHREPILPYPLSPTKTVPSSIVKPPYARTGTVLYSREMDEVQLHSAASIRKMRRAARLASRVLHQACALATIPGTTTDEIDTLVHQAIVAAEAYPSPLQYAGFPKSVCTSVNEVICHGIPDQRPLQFGDVISLDVSCYVNGVHGDNCATVIVGDYNDDVNHTASTVPSASSSANAVAATTNYNNNNTNTADCDWRGVPYRTRFATPHCEAHFIEMRRLVQATQDALFAAIATVQPGSCLTEIGEACQMVAEQHGYASVTKYRGHGIGAIFHTAPFVKHYRNSDTLTLQAGMIFTIEPMLCQYSADCFEWEHDHWTVSTEDEGCAAQFEHTVLVTETGVEILTLPLDDDDGNALHQ